MEYILVIYVALCFIWCSWLASGLGPDSQAEGSAVVGTLRNVGCAAFAH